MNPELYMIILAGFCAICFALGGTKISESIDGQKWIRRFFLPFAVILPCVWTATTWWQGCITSVLACILFHLGYGDRASWLKRAMIFAGYGLISIPVGISWWSAITAVSCLIMMWLSRSGLPKVFVWKFCELMFGFLVGFSIGFLLAGNGIVW